EVFREEPLYVDLTGVRGAANLHHDDPNMRMAVAKIAAAIRHMSLDEIFGEDVSQHRRTRFIAGIGILAMAITAAVAARGWVLEFAARTEAQQQQHEAE